MSCVPYYKHSSPNYLDRSCHVFPTANTLPNYLDRPCHVSPTSNTLPNYLFSIDRHVMCPLLQTLFP